MKIKLIIFGFLLGGILIFLNDRYVFEAIMVPSSSMRPTILPNERIFLQKVFYRPLQRFDVVVIQNANFGARVIKRIVALPGECVQLRDSWQVWINDKALNYQQDDGESPSIKSEEGHHLIQLEPNPKISYETKFGKTPLCLGPDEYYALGDNRLASGDSRAFGPVKGDEIQGKATYIWYSFDLKEGKPRAERFLRRIR